MKTRLDIKHDGNLGAENRTRMTFDENSIAHLMGVLTDLYSDPAAAVIREYATNAWDSHRAAGITDPIEITLPSSLAKFYVVKDHGLGLSIEDVEEHFSKYGWSSKRETNNEVGMLGLGCKSALSYTSQFTLVVTKDGDQGVVLVTRDEDGCGAVQVVDKYATDEPNGVEVTIPVAHVNMFNEKANHFFRCWEPGSVLVNGEAPVPYGQDEDDLVLDPDVILSPDLEHDYIVMGNVPYPVADCALSGYDRDARAMVRVEIGDVDFAPSREALLYNARTQYAVERAKEFIDNRVPVMAQAAIDAAPDHLAALEVAKQWAEGFPYSRRQSFGYRGTPLPMNGTIKHPDGHLRWVSLSKWVTGGTYVREFQPDQQAARQDRIAVPVPDSETQLHMIGYKANHMTALTKKKVIKYIEQAGLDVNVVLAYRKPIDSPWIAPAHTVAWEVVRGMDVARPKAANGTTASRYKQVGRSGAVSFNDAVDLSKVSSVAYLVAGDSRHLDLWRIGDVLRDAKDMAIAWVPKNRVEQFKEAYPHASPLRTFIIDIAHLYLAQFDRVDRAWVTGKLHEDDRARHLRSMAKLDTDRILDRELAKAIRGSVQRREVNDNHRHMWNNICFLARHLGVGPELPTVETTTVPQTSAILQQYPLLPLVTGAYGLNGDDVIEYVNTLYLVREGLLLSRAYI